LEGNEMQVEKDFGVMPTEKQADETVSREGALQTDTAREAKGDGRSTCTCHPDDRPPVCQREFATTHCNLAYAQKQLSEIARKAGGGLCQLTGGGKHEFLREISFLCEEAGYDVLGDKRPRPPKAGLKSVEDATRTSPGTAASMTQISLKRLRRLSGTASLFWPTIFRRTAVSLCSNASAICSKSSMAHAPVLS
jgi:hypothetical protein